VIATATGKVIVIVRVIVTETITEISMICVTHVGYGVDEDDFAG